MTGAVSRLLDATAPFLERALAGRCTRPAQPGAAIQGAS